MMALIHDKHVFDFSFHNLALTKTLVIINLPSTRDNNSVNVNSDRSKNALQTTPSQKVFYNLTPKPQRTKRHANVCSNPTE